MFCTSKPETYWHKAAQLKPLFIGRAIEILKVFTPEFFKGKPPANGRYGAIPAGLLNYNLSISLPFVFEVGFLLVTYLALVF